MGAAGEIKVHLCYILSAECIVPEKVAMCPRIGKFLGDMI